MFSRHGKHDRAIIHMNSQRLWLSHKSYVRSSSQNASTNDEGLTKSNTNWRAIVNWWLWEEKELDFFRSCPCTVGSPTLSSITKWLSELKKKKEYMKFEEGVGVGSYGKKIDLIKMETRFSITLERASMERRQSLPPSTVLTSQCSCCKFKRRKKLRGTWSAWH